jgi:putative copper export protein
MILEYLQPDASFWDGLAVVVRALYHVATIGAAGLVLFLLAFDARLLEAERSRLRALLGIAIAAGVAASVVALGLRAIVLSAEGLAGLFRTDLYPAIFASRIGDAFLLRAGGLVLMLLALGGTLPWRIGGSVGALVALASYVAMGHTTLYLPREPLVALIFTHLVAVAFWAGSLPALHRVAGRADPASAAALIAAWSRLAMLAVAVLIVTGLLAAWYLVGRYDLLLASWYGWALMAKVAIVAGVLALALRHKLRLTPALAAGHAGAGARLARSIRAEMWLVAAVFYAAAELVSVHPIDYGHRIQPPPKPDSAGVVAPPAESGAVTPPPAGAATARAQ